MDLFIINLILIFIYIYLNINKKICKYLYKENKYMFLI